MILNKAKTLAVNLLKKHGLSYQGWQFKFNRAKTKFGICDYGNKIIFLSRYYVLLNSRYLVKDTVLHEIAHAILGPDFYDEETKGHNMVWQALAKVLGASSKRFVSLATKTPLRWRIECPNCGIVEITDTKPNMKANICGDCFEEVSFIDTQKEKISIPRKK